MQGLKLIGLNEMLVGWEITPIKKEITKQLVEKETKTNIKQPEQIHKYSLTHTLYDTVSSAFSVLV